MTASRKRPPPLRLLIATGSADRRIATISGDRLADFLILGSGETPLIGQISLGRIAKIDRGLEAAFVDCGGGQTGFLSLRDAPSGITEGQRLIVQVAREAFDGKSMRLTARPVLPGYRLSFAPFTKSPNFPDGIADPVKQRLQRLLESLGDARRGVSPRCHAIDADAALLRAEAESLRTQWVEIERKGAAATAPMLLQPAPEPLLDLIRSHASALEEICCDTRTAAAQITALCRSLDDELAGKVTFRPRRDWLPSVAELEEQIDETLAGEAVLPVRRGIAFCRNPGHDRDRRR